MIELTKMSAETRKRAFLLFLFFFRNPSLPCFFVVCIAKLFDTRPLTRPSQHLSLYLSVQKEKMNYGHRGRDLLLELKRARANDHKPSASTVVPPYNDRLVRETLEDLQLHMEALQCQVDALSGGNPSINVKPSLLLQKTAIERNKRCLLAYHKIRIDRLTDAYWNNGVFDDAVKANLSPSEEEFCQKYAEICRSYASRLRFPQPDLRAYGNHPPQPLTKVQVQVTKSTDGPVVLESGSTLTFTKGSVHYLSYSDVEGFLRDGTLALLSTEEEDDMHQAATSMGRNYD
jgi:GINS complex subunit 1